MIYRISSVIRQNFFSFQNNHKNLDLQCMLLDGSRSLGLFRKGKTLTIAKFHRSDFVIFIVILERGNSRLIAE